MAEDTARSEFDVVIIGGGIAGQAAALDLAGRRFSVALVERDVPGRQHTRSGDLMLQVITRASHLVEEARRASRFGAAVEFRGVNYADLVRRRDEVVKVTLGGRPVARLEQAGIRVVSGHGRLRSAQEVETDGAVLRGRAVLLATGAQPFIPAIPGLDDLGFLVPDTVLDYYHRPRTLIVLGGGAVGVTFAQAFRRFGAGVTLIERAPRILTDAEPEISEAMSRALQDDGVRVFTDCTVYGVQEQRDGQHVLRFQRGRNGDQQAVTAEAVLVAAGRVPAVAGLGLEAAGVQVGPRGVVVDPTLRTTAPSVWACGDVVGVFHLAHMAQYEAEVAAQNIASALRGLLPEATVNYTGVPWAYPTDPEIAQVGLREEDARAAGRAVVVGRARFADLSRAVTLDEARGLVKVVADAETARVLGVHIVGPRAAEIISEASLALHTGLTAHDIAHTRHPAASLAEVLRRAAAEAARSLT